MFNIINDHKFDIDEVEIEMYIKYMQDEMDEFRDFTLVFLESEEIRNLNLEFREKDYATDVLTFCEEGDYLGDVLINYKKISEQASSYNHSFKREMYFLITHGFLHLLGYDHIDSDDEVIMFDLQEKLLDKYNIRRINEQ